MKLKVPLMLLLSIVLANCSSSKNVYLVKSIKELPANKCYLIKVYKVNDTAKTQEVWIISDFEKKKDFEQNTKISEGMNLKLSNLTEIAESENPFKQLLQSNRKGKQAIYVDGKLLYDPKIKLYSSGCIEGLFYDLDCR